MLQIDKSNAAAIAAIIAGVFALTKELATFLLDLVKTRLTGRREQNRLLARLGQFHFQLAVGSSHALEAWIQTKKELAMLGYNDLPQPPAVDFVNFIDSALEQHVGDLSVRAPEIVSQYIHASRLAESLSSTFTQENETFGEAPFFYSYPRTRKYLRAILNASVTGLEQVCSHYPEDLWNPGSGPKGRYGSAARSFKRQLERIPVIDAVQLRQEGVEALVRLRGINPKSSES